MSIEIPRKSQIRKDSVSSATHKHTAIKESPGNIRLKPGQRMGIRDRFKGYFRLENGQLWCHNQEELDS